MSTPFCKDCSHVRNLAGRHPMCAHPEAKRDPVTGISTTDCRSARWKDDSYCGPTGLGYWPAAKVAA